MYTKFVLILNIINLLLSCHKYYKTYRNKLDNNKNRSIICLYEFNILEHFVVGIKLFYE